MNGVHVFSVVVFWAAVGQVWTVLLWLQSQWKVCLLWCWLMIHTLQQLTGMLFRLTLTANIWIKFQLYLCTRLLLAVNRHCAVLYAACNLPVQMIAWKDSSPRCPVTCWAGHKTLLTHLLVSCCVMLAVTAWTEWEALHWWSIDVTSLSFYSITSPRDPPTRSSTSHLGLLSVPRHNLSFGSRAFRTSAPKIWNSLPPHILQSQTLSSLRHHLKTRYFQSAYPAP